MYLKIPLEILIIVLGLAQISQCENVVREVEKVLSKCKINSTLFDVCITNALNDLRPYFKQGIPELGVAPFDPHFASEVKHTQEILGLQYTLFLRNVYERGWTNSTVTKYRTDKKHQLIKYSQYFPEKWIDGQYEFKGDMWGARVLRQGQFNLTLRDYSQTTRISRNTTKLDVKVEVDRIGDMELHVANLLRGRSNLEQILDVIINSAWKPGFAVLKPTINDIVSTAFTDIFNKAFRNIPIEKFISNRHDE